MTDFGTGAAAGAGACFAKLGYTTFPFTVGSSTSRSMSLSNSSSPKRSACGIFFGVVPPSTIGLFCDPVSSSNTLSKAFVNPLAVLLMPPFCRGGGALIWLIADCGLGRRAFWKPALIDFEGGGLEDGGAGGLEEKRDCDSVLPRIVCCDFFSCSCFWAAACNMVACVYVRRKGSEVRRRDCMVFVGNVAAEASRAVALPGWRRTIIQRTKQRGPYFRHLQVRKSPRKNRQKGRCGRECGRQIDESSRQSRGASATCSSKQRAVNA